MQFILLFLAGMFALPILQTLLGNAASTVVSANMQKITDSTATSVQNTLSQVTGGVVPPKTPAVNTGGAELPQPSPNDQLGNRLTNPWLYVSLGVFGYVTVAGIKQLRGAGRDLGSGVKSTRRAFQEDLGGEP